MEVFLESKGESLKETALPWAAPFEGKAFETDEIRGNNPMEWPNPPTEPTTR